MRRNLTRGSITLFNQSTNIFKYFAHALVRMCSNTLCILVAASVLSLAVLPAATRAQNGSFGDILNSTYQVIEPDSLLQNEWWPKASKLPQAWTMATGKGVTIAACDTGVYTQAKDLQYNLITSQARNFANPDNRWDVSKGSYVSQGTASAGIMVGAKNFSGINGIAYDAMLVPLQNFHYSQKLDKISLEIATARCIRYATALERVSIIAVQALPTSQGTIEANELVRKAIEDAIKSGVTVVVPAGDSTKELNTERVYDSGSIIVGALTQSGETAIFSNFGSRITISTYGERIKALWGPYGETRYFGGTLAASAQIAGMAALAKEINPSLMPYDIKWLLKKTRDRSTMNYRVGGKVNLIKFLFEAKHHTTDPSKEDAARRYRRQLAKKILKEKWAQ